MLATVTSLVVLLIDQISKYWVQTNPALHDVKIINGFFHITYARNTGMAWSMLSGQQVLLSLIAAAAIGVMIWYLINKKPDKYTTFAVALMIGGAAGNLIDRLVYNYVRDFLNFYIFGYDFPIFNIADSALCIGVFILFILMLKEEKNDSAKVDR